MENIYANPVGIIKKSIYIIKNDINEKVYIGQSINPKERFKSHCKNSNDNSLITKAIFKYGKEHFSYEILELDIKDYNEKEKFYITLFNSLSPNGYNVQLGGDIPPVFYGHNHPLASIKSEEELYFLTEDLKNTNYSYAELARKYNTNKHTILRINNGISYVNTLETYPLRKIKNTSNKLTEEDVLQILDILQLSYRQYADIGAQFNVEAKTIESINLGKTYIHDEYTYPIRTYKNSGIPQFTYEDINEIIDLITTTSLSYRMIAKQYNSSHNIIIEIKNGTSKRYFRKGLTYPLRKN